MAEQDNKPKPILRKGIPAMDGYVPPKGSLPPPKPKQPAASKKQA